MKTGVKVALWIAGALVALAVAVVVVLPLVFNPNDFKPQIARMLSQRTGRQVSIPGKIELSVFPWLGASVGKVEIANAKGFGSTPFAEVQKASVHIKLLPLVLHRRVRLGILNLDGLTLHLMRNKQGQSNWADLVSPHAAPAPSAQSGASGSGKPAARGSGFSLPTWQVAGVDVRNAGASWDDARTNKHYTIRHLLLRTGKIAPGEPFTVNLSFEAESPRPAAKATVDAVVHVNADRAHERVSFSDLRLTVLAEGNDVPGGQQQLVVSGAGQADLGAGTAQVTKLDVEAVGLSMTGKMVARDITSAPHLSGQLAVASFNPRHVLDKLALPPPTTADKTALTQAAFKLVFTEAGGRFDASKVDATLDDSHLTGHASLGGGSPRAVDFTFVLDRLNADRYLPPSQKAAKSQSSGAGTAGESAGSANGKPLPVEVIKSLDLDGHLRVGQLQVKGAKMRDVDLTLAAHNGRLRIQPLSAKLYGGVLHTTAQIDAASRPTYKIDSSVSGLQSGPLTHDVMGRTWIDGVTQMKMNLTAAGGTTVDVRKSLAGRIRFAFRNGAIHGFNLAQFIRQAQATLQGGQAPAAKDQTTDFSTFDGTVNIHRGVASNDDLRLMSPLLRVGGKGQADMVRNRIDYLLKATVVKSLQGQGGLSASALSGVTVPLRLSGDLFAPRVRLDMAELAREHLQNRQKQLQQKLKDQEKNLGQKALDRLQKLFQ